MDFDECCWIIEEIATNQGVVGSIPASRTKRKTLEQQCSRVFSFLPCVFADAVDAVAR